MVIPAGFSDRNGFQVRRPRPRRSSPTAPRARRAAHTGAASLDILSRVDLYQRRHAQSARPGEPSFSRRAPGSAGSICLRQITKPSFARLGRRPKLTIRRRPAMFKRARCPRSQERHHMPCRTEAAASLDILSRVDLYQRRHAQSARPVEPSFSRRAPGSAGSICLRQITKPSFARLGRRPKLTIRRRPAMFKRARCPRSRERHHMPCRTEAAASLDILSRVGLYQRRHAQSARPVEPSFSRRAPGSAGSICLRQITKPSFARLGRRPKLTIRRRPAMFKRAGCPRSQERHHMPRRSEAAASLDILSRVDPYRRRHAQSARPGEPSFRKWFPA